MFRGETLRGLLLNAYAFGTIGQIMLRRDRRLRRRRAAARAWRSSGSCTCAAPPLTAEIFPQTATRVQVSSS